MKNEVLRESNNDVVVWTPKHEDKFIDLMEEEVINGNKLTTTFTKQSWKCIKGEICSHTKINYSEMQIWNKFSMLKPKHNDFKALLNETDMGYNVVTGQANAGEEVWDKHTRVNMLTKKFKKDEFCAAYGDTTAIGSNAHLSNRSLANVGDHDVLSKRDNKNQDENAKGEVDPSERLMRPYLPHYLLDESVEALDAIPGISGVVYAKAIEKFENEVSRALFLKMPQHRRIDWLLNLK